MDGEGRRRQFRGRSAERHAFGLRAGKSDNTLAVVEISNPTVDGKDLVYSYKLIDGALPTSGGATSLFIDWIGVGGGVGFGYHGVGVGARGVGVL